jgi:hypothetical protein
MRSSYGHSRVSSPVLIRDPLAEDLSGAFSRHAKVRVAPQAAHAASGKSLVPFWRRWWRSL